MEPSSASLLGQRITTYRHSRKLTQYQLARLADVPANTLSRLERGLLDKPSVWLIAAVAQALNLSLDALLNTPPLSSEIHALIPRNSMQSWMLLGLVLGEERKLVEARYTMQRGAHYA